MDNDINNDDESKGCGEKLQINKIAEEDKGGFG
jgi:hypothetical protein